MKEISRYRLSDTFSAYAIAAHPFEDVILIGESNTIHYIDRVSGRRLKSFKALGQRIFNMTYDQKGKYLVTAARDLKLKIWDLGQNNQNIPCFRLAIDALIRRSYQYDYDY